MAYVTLNDQQFDRDISLRDAYRIMERFLAGSLSRGDMPVSDLLHFHVGEVGDGGSTDSATLYDFLAATVDVLDKQL